MHVLTGIPASDLQARQEKLLHDIQSRELRGYILFDRHYIQYVTGFDFLATERPVAFVSNASGETAIFVPAFEAERAHAEGAFERIETYPEYPGTEHPMHLLQAVLSHMGIEGSLGADQDGYPGILGYQGPSLSAVTGGHIAPLAPRIEHMMARKSEAEVALIRESARWCGVAHERLQHYTRPGTTETEASIRAGSDATLAMLDALGPRYGGQQASSDGASAGYRGQIGRQSAWAHALARNIVFHEGDVLVSETSAPIWGYNAELERAMIVGTPTDEMRRLFGHMLAAQQVAFDTLRPGVTCGEVDRAVLSYFESNDLMPYWRQHTGHAIGLRNHEAPFLDVGDDTRVDAGMVFTIEPGLYTGDIGGFRHSDTVHVTPDGIDILTDYPRDLDSLIIAA